MKRRRSVGLTANILGQALFCSAALAGLEAYVNPLDGNVPVPREVRVDADESRKLAFPSARGHGRFADPDIGPGQVFQVLKVTNTHDSGPGSYREGLMATGPRVLIFTISGTIDLTEDVLAREAQDDIYLAGQTSPGGVQLKCSGNNRKAPLRFVRTSDIVARFLKLRPGLDHALSSNMGALGAGEVENAIFDHLSMQWTTDEGGYVTSKGAGATLQWSIQSEPVRCGSCRDDGHPNHDYGFFSDRNENITLYKNFFMGGYWRNPNVQATRSLELINNVAYNYGEYAAQFYVNSVRGNLIANLVGNWYSKGPRTPGNPYCFLASWEGPSTNGFEFYVHGNVDHRDISGNANMAFDGPLLTSPILQQVGTLLTPSGTVGVIFSTPRAGGLSVPKSDIVTAEQALKDVIASAGALQDVFSTPRRDLVDERSVSQLQHCGDRSYTPQPDPLNAIPAPGYPDLVSGATWTWAGNDVDNDGMLDSWEELYADLSLVPNGDPDGDGWSNMEEFLNYMAGEHIQWVGTGDPFLVPPANCGYPVAPQPDPMADTDGDELPDAWELSQLATLAASSDDDTDGDRMSNREELLAGTNPGDAADYLSLVIRSLGSAGVLVEVPTVMATQSWFAGKSRTYSLESAHTPGRPWEPLPGEHDVPASQGIIDHAPADDGASFRVKVTLE